MEFLTEIHTQSGLYKVVDPGYNLDVKRFLFLDDNKDRHDGFDIHCIGLPVTVTHVWTADQAIETLKAEEPFDTVWLDHDLENTDPNFSGACVAEFIAFHIDKAKTPKHVVVHSHNPCGAITMMDMLHAAGISCSRVEFRAPQSVRSF